MRVTVLFCVVLLLAGGLTSSAETDSSCTRAQGRIFAVPTVQVWRAALEVLDEHRFELEKSDETHGIIVTEWRRFARKRFPEMELCGLPEGARPDRFRLHLFVPPWAEPGRLYVGSIVELTTSQGGRLITHNAGGMESWFHERVASLLISEGHEIPGDVEQRRALVSRLLGNEDGFTCLDATTTHPMDIALETHLAGVGDVSNPELVLSAMVEPLYPSSAFTTGQEAALVLQAIIREDGFVSEVEVLRNDSPNPNFEVAARRAVSLWRYQPAKKGDCPVPVYFTVFVDFKLGRDRR